MMHIEFVVSIQVPTNFVEAINCSESRVEKWN